MGERIKLESLLWESKSWESLLWESVSWAVECLSFWVWVNSIMAAEMKAVWGGLST